MRIVGELLFSRLPSPPYIKTFIPTGCMNVANIYGKVVRWNLSLTHINTITRDILIYKRTNRQQTWANTHTWGHINSSLHSIYSYLYFIRLDQFTNTILSKHFTKHVQYTFLEVCFIYLQCWYVSCKYASRSLKVSRARHFNLIIPQWTIV